jgi:protein-tyrosine phosphatase
MTESQKDQVSVLFVCMGNIRHHVSAAGLDKLFEIDSAGTHAYHVGEPPDRRAQQAAARRGFSLADIRARRVGPEDFERFHHIIAMDEDNLVMLHEQADAAHREKIRLFLEFGSGPETEVPDPYYGGATGFERVLDLVEDASRGLLENLRQR